MHVAVDMDDMCITHVHTDTNILGALTYLECPAKHVIRLEDSNSPHFLDVLTTLELNLLYISITGEAWPSDYAGDDLVKRALLATLVENMKPRKVREVELDAQIEFVHGDPDLSPGLVNWRYVYGAKRPMVDDGGLMQLMGPPAKKAQLAQAIAASARMVALAAMPQPTPGTPKAPGAPRPARQTTGNTTALIWAHADKVWEGVGKPTDRAVVLKLRGQIMDEMQAEGFNRNTVSNTLGGWQKDRIK